jgi:hypothetical protein
VGSSAVHAEPNPAYDHIRKALAEQQGAAQFGDPSAVGAALLQIVDAAQPPLRVLLGSQPTQIV